MAAEQFAGAVQAGNRIAFDIAEQAGQDRPPLAIEIFADFIPIDRRQSVFEAGA